MRQGNGSDIFKTDDPRAASIGIIYVSPNDEKKSVFAAILTQEKLKRKQIVVVLPVPNKAFQHPADFSDLKTLQRKIESQVIFVLPKDSPQATFARQRRFLVFSSLENFAASPQKPDQTHKQWHLPQLQTKHEAPMRGSSIRPLPSLPHASKKPEDTNEMTIYLGSDEDLATVRERLKNTSSKHIILVVPSQTLLRSHVVWRLLSTEVRQQGKEVTVISADSQLRAIARSARFPVAESLELRNTPLRRRPGRPTPARVMPPFSSNQASHKEMPPPLGEESIPAEETPLEVVPPIESTPPTLHKLNNDPFSFMDDFAPWQPDEQNPLPTVNPVKEILLDDLWDDPDDYNLAQSIRQAAQQQPPAPDVDRIPEITDLPPGRPDHDDDDILLPPWSRIERNNEPMPDLPPRPPTRRRPSLPLSSTPPQPPVRRRTAQLPESGPIRPRSSRQLSGPSPATRQRNAIPPRRRTPGQSRSRFRPRLIAFSILVLTMLAFSMIFVVPGALVNFRIIQPPPVTVTIIPASLTLQKTYGIAASTTPPIASQHQVRARFLSYTTSSQTETTKATGMGQRPAIAARGSLTLYNALHFVQTVAAGTVFTDANGVQVVNDRIASIPAAQLPTEGFVTVAAHALIAGASGNIPTLDFNGVACCSQGITVQNAAAFSGGQDTQNYTFVQQSDIDGVVTPLQGQITQNGQASLKAQILPGEQAIGPTQCLPAISSDHAAGDKATSVTVTMTVTCTDEVYDQQGALAMATNLLQMDATQRPGPGYSLMGTIKTLLTNVQVSNAAKTLSLLVTAKGKWVYQFNTARRQNMALVIAGKSESDAQTLLQHMGVAKADIRHEWPGGTIMPDKPNQITFIVQQG